ncbi:MAG: ABC transporter permease [Planctomycetes bacterium]|nr:ABC transporter permease [Planctomycetota bacterium]
MDRSTVAGLVAEIDKELRGKPARLTVDLGAVESFDSAGLGGVVAGLRRAGAAGVELKLKGMSQPMVDFFSLVSIQRLTQPAAVADRADPVTRLGTYVEPMFEGALNVASTAGAALRELFIGPFQRRFLRLDRTAIEVDHCAAGALPIIALIAFLLGLILAMQAYVQLRVWGAEIYMADMVGVSVLAEIGPLMTAIVLAARSGSSPQIGHSFELALGNLPFTGPVFLFLGLSDTSYGPTPLPYSLGGLGAPGCSILCSGEAPYLLTNVLGSALWSWNVPNVPGVSFYNQAFGFDPAANALGLSASNAGRGTIGF